MKVFVILVSLATLVNCQQYSTNGKKEPSDPDIIMFPHNHDFHTHSHDHSINYHRNHNHNHDYDHHDDLFTVEPEVELTTIDSTSNQNQIPLDLIQKLNSIQNASDFISNFIKEDTLVEQPLEIAGFITSRFNGPDVERSAAIIPKPAMCTPELTTVPLVSEESHSIFYFPSCTRVMRCGGCCQHSLLSCQPTKTETLYFQVIKSQFSGGSQLTYKGKETIAIEQHNKCKCDCTEKAEHCNQFQEYHQSECRCVCNNSDDEKKCYKDNDTRIWDPNSCSCRCRESKDCTSGYFYDQNQCKCVQIPIRRRIADHPAGGETSAEYRRRLIIPLAAHRYSTAEEERAAAARRTSRDSIR